VTATTRGTAGDIFGELRAIGSLIAHIRLALRPTDGHAFYADAFCARSSAKHQAQLRIIPRGQSHKVGSWEVVIATLHTDLLVHSLVHNYVSNGHHRYQSHSKWEKYKAGIEGP
jgi:hypothetical protein